MGSTYDLTYDDFNPTIIFSNKIKRVQECKYHSHQDFTQLTYILSGKGKYLVDGVSYDAEAGDLFVFNPGVQHKNIVLNWREPTVEFVAGFTDFHFKDMPENIIKFQEESHLIKTDSKTRHEINKHCYEMLAENEAKKLGKYFMLKTHLMQIILLFMRDLTDGKTKEKKLDLVINENFQKSYTVKQIINYLDENYTHKISLDQISQKLYLSPVYISKIFKEETGDSPINYLIKIRLEKAKEILERTSSGSVKSIANEVGYEDVYYFSKLFKKNYGISPMYYRKKAVGDDT